MKLLFLILGCCVSVSVLADESDFTQTPDLPLVSSAARIPQLMPDAAASITVITRETIDASGARTLPEVFRLVPGFSVYRVNANKTAVSYHGVSDDFPNRVEVRIDNRTAYMPMMSTVDWTSLGITLDDVERIEVVRGSNSAAQGSNAFLGAINIQTRNPMLSDTYDVTTTVGNRTTYDQHLSYATTTDIGSFRVSSSYQSNNGSNRYDDGINRGVLNVSGMIPLDAASTLSFNAGVDRGYIVSSTDYSNASRQMLIHGKRHHRSQFQNLTYEHLLSDDSTIRLNLSHTQASLKTPQATNDQLRQFFSLGAIPDSIIDQFRSVNTGLNSVAEDGKNNSWTTEAQWSKRYQDIAVVGGIEIQHNDISSPVLLQRGSESENRFATFGTLEWHATPNWIFNTGLRQERNTANTTANSYRQSATYKPDADSSIRLAYAHSERLPSLLEDNQNGRYYLPSAGGRELLTVDSNTLEKLAPEVNKSWELAYYRAFEDHNYIDVRLFDEHIEDAIGSYHRAITDADIGSDTPSSSLSSTVRSHNNVYEWRNRGVELQSRIQLNDELWTLLNYTYQHVNGTPTTADFSQTPINSYTPRHMGSVILAWNPVPQWHYSLIQYYQSGTHWIQNERTYQRNWKRTDLKVTKDWALERQMQLQTSLLVQGLFDSQYHEYSIDNEYGRGIFFQLKLSKR